MWFEKLTGFKEESPDNVRQKLFLKGDTLYSTVNDKSFSCGQLEVLSLAELRERSSAAIEVYQGKISCSELIGDVQILHTLSSNKQALFQVASQFNLLEMIGPQITPEQGIDRYERDYTQGPACAIACGAGTIYRNYFVELEGQLGQTANKQIDCLDLIAKELDNEKLKLWTMQNGYALVSQEGLLTINKRLAELKDKERDALKAKLKVGIQWNTEVTISETKQEVSQIYCAALPVAYSSTDSIYWESFARLILEASYEATLHAAMLNMKENKSNLLYLTLLGGGAFGNELHWILESLSKLLYQFKNLPLDVRIVSYGQSNPAVAQLTKEVNGFNK